MNNSIIDKNGNHVLISTETWTFICDVHPELSDYFKYLLQAIEVGVWKQITKTTWRYCKKYVEADVSCSLVVLCRLLNEKINYKPSFEVFLAYLTLKPEETIWR